MESEDRGRGTGVGTALTKFLKHLNEIGCRSYIWLFNVTWIPWHITHKLQRVPGESKSQRRWENMVGIQYVAFSIAS
jgi:hypothetical protein